MNSYPLQIEKKHKTHPKITSPLRIEQVTRKRVPPGPPKTSSHRKSLKRFKRL